MYIYVYNIYVYTAQDAVYRYTHNKHTLKEKHLIFTEKNFCFSAVNNTLELKPCVA